MNEFEVTVDGRTLRGYDSGPRDGTVVVWHHGTPNIGSPPEPLFDVSDRLGIRWVGYDRPGYGGSTRNVGRTIASAASDTAAVVGHLGIDRFAVVGHSGGGTHALACGALLPERVSAVVSVSGVAPYGADGLDWFGGMSPSGVASLHAALEGREAKERYEASAPEGDPGFVPADYAALAGTWAWFQGIAGAAIAGGPAGLVDDDLAYVADWGFDVADVTPPTLIVHGGADGMVPSSHAEWLAAHCPNTELWLEPDDGHISVLRTAPAALEWLVKR